MRRFRFALRRVQGLRQHQERAARLAMAKELAALNTLEQRRQQIDGNLETCGEQGQGAQMPVLAAALESGLLRARQRLAGQIAAANERVRVATDVYRERRRDLMTLDKLQERAWESWKKEAQAEEQREFDEMARLRFAAQESERRR